jgi:uncharacterized membrane protein YhaH (DUF805 family)
MNESRAAHRRTPFPACLFSLTGRIGPGWYFVGLVVALAALLGALACVVSASRPTGSGDGPLLLGFPLLALFAWIVIAAMVQRLRDAGRRPALAIVFILAPLLVLAGMALSEEAGPLLAMTAVGIIAAPAFLAPKPGDEPAAPR